MNFQHKAVILLSTLICFTSVSSIAADKQAIQESSNQAPNIVFFIADDHGREALGAYGNNTIRTPNLDQLASEGLLFENAYATTASCSASRSVILTGLHNHANGQYGHDHGIHHFRTFDKIKSLPVRLAKAGYRTARVGKYHVGPEKVYHFDEVLEDFKVYKPDGSRNTVGMALASQSFIAKKDSKPFFLYLATNDPHRSGKTNTLGDNVFGNKKDLGEGMARLNYEPSKVTVPDYLNDTPATRRELAEQYESISRVDNTMGVLVQSLKDAGVYENTIIFYFSDNGSAMPGAKTTIYEPGVKLPLIVKLPKAYAQRAGEKVTEFISWTDLTPTALDFANADYDKADFNGRTFKPVLTNTNTKHEDWNTIYGSHSFHEITMYYPMRMIRSGKYKLVWNIASGLDYPFANDLYKSSTWQSTLKANINVLGSKTIDNFIHRPAFELFDLSADPSESKNLADDPDYLAVKESLMAKLMQFQKETKDPWVVKWLHE